MIPIASPNRVLHETHTGLQTRAQRDAFISSMSRNIQSAAMFKGICGKEVNSTWYCKEELHYG